MNSKEKVIFSWSGGKDSSLALFEILNKGQYHIESLITTVTADYGRVSIHGLRTELLQAQSESLGLPIDRVTITKNASNDEYENEFLATTKKYRDSGINKIIFGDIFLEDIAHYRKALMSKIGMECIFPIWKRDSILLAKSFIEEGFRAVIVCVDTEQLDAEFTGRTFDERLLSDLPPGVDPCGENGEFHTFVFDGPIFNNPIDHKLGHIVLRDERFCYCDVLPE